MKDTSEKIYLLFSKKSRLRVYHEKILFAIYPGTFLTREYASQSH